MKYMTILEGLSRHPWDLRPCGLGAHGSQALASH